MSQRSHNSPRWGLLLSLLLFGVVSFCALALFTAGDDLLPAQGPLVSEPGSMYSPGAPEATRGDGSRQWPTPAAPAPCPSFALDPPRQPEAAHSKASRRSSLTPIYIHNCAFLC